jgi:hypothetical protein
VKPSKTQGGYATTRIVCLPPVFFVKYPLLVPFNDGGNDDHYGYRANRDVYVCLTFHQGYD